MTLQLVDIQDVPGFLEKAKKHWTPEREKKVTSGKKYLLKPAQGALLLRYIGLLNSDASMSADAVRKYIQINHMILKLEPFIKNLSDRFECVRIVDCGCGSSFLTFLLAWCFENIWKKKCEIIGIDTNAQLIAKSTTISNALGFNRMLRFACENINAASWDDLYKSIYSSGNDNIRPHAVISLHACDTATCQTLIFALQNKADFVAVAPCCQAELAKKWEGMVQTQPTHALASLFATPALRRTVAADITDLLRVLYMRSKGYEVTISEFVESKHSAKNKLITCERRGNFYHPAAAEFTSIKNHFGNASITLEGFEATPQV